MAPNKFEENIKDKLDNRRLQPSSDAWSKLSDRLDDQEKKQKGFPFWWLGIAASIIGVLLVATQFYKREIIEKTPKIVVTPEVIKQQESTQFNLKESNDILIDHDETKVTEVKQPLKRTAILKEQLLVEEAVTINQKALPELNKETKIPEQGIIKELTLEDQKIQDVVAQVQKLQELNTEVTDATIDALLQEAQKEIRLKNMFNETAGVVDANALLQGVEDDLEQSFRGKVFQALKENYITVKTAVAQRNN